MAALLYVAPSMEAFLSPGLLQSFLGGPGGGLKTGECELPLCLDLSGLNCHTSTKSLAEFFFSSYLPAFLSFSALGKTLLLYICGVGGVGRLQTYVVALGIFSLVLFSSVKFDSRLCVPYCHPDSSN